MFVPLSGLFHYIIAILNSLDVVVANLSRGSEDNCIKIIVIFLVTTRFLSFLYLGFVYVRLLLEDIVLKLLLCFLWSLNKTRASRVGRNISTSFQKLQSQCQNQCHRQYVLFRKYFEVVMFI